MVRLSQADYRSLIEDFAHEWGWRVSFHKKNSILVDLERKQLKFGTPKLKKDDITWIVGIITRTHPNECGSSSPAGRKVKTINRTFIGPSYWINSCNVDSILSFLAFSERPEWRKLMLASVNLKDDTKEVLKEILYPEGKCFLLRKRLFGNRREMVGVGHSYDLLTDLFPHLKIPVTTNKTIFYSSIPLEDYLAGDISINKINYPILVLENHLGYDNPQSFFPERNRPTKKRILKAKMGKWQLIGVTYLSGVGPVVDNEKEMFQMSRLGDHYYSIVKTTGGWVEFDDLSPKGKKTNLGENFSKKGKDVGVMYYFVNLSKIKSEKMVVIDDKTVWVSRRLESQVKKNITSLKGVKVSISKNKIVIDFDKIETRVEFEEKLRKELGD